jgi:hypothetical protein
VEEKKVERPRPVVRMMNEEVTDEKLPEAPELKASEVKTHEGQGFRRRRRRRRRGGKKRHFENKSAL